MSLRAPFEWLLRRLSRRARASPPAADTDFEAAVARASAIHGESPIAQFVDEGRRNELARSLYLELHGIFDANDRVSACRDKLVPAMLSFAPLRVVTLAAPPSPDPSGLRGLPGISGELNAHLDKILQHDLELRRRIEASGPPADRELKVQGCFWEAKWFLESFNAARLIVGDTVADRDWYRPFMHAACVNQEHLYRRMLDLPPLFDEELAQSVVSAYSIYTDVIVAGAPDPDLEWRQYCEELQIPELAAGGEYMPPFPQALPGNDQPAGSPPSPE